MISANRSWKKQKKRKKEAAVAGTGKQWWNLLQ